jgi:hypothetical protein
VAALGVGTLIPSCSAEDIRIRLVNGQTGEPINRPQPVVLYLGRNHSGFLDGTTDMDGVAVFRLPDPLADWITAGEDSQTLYHCSPYRKSVFSTAEIARAGGVAPNTCDPKGKLKGKVEAKPGEVVIFARPLRWWEKAQW